MKAAIHLGLNYLANLKVYKNTNFEEIQSLFNITQKLILEHPEENLNVSTIDNASPSWTRSVLSHDQVIQRTRAEVRVYTDSVLCLGKMNESNDAITRWAGQVEFSSLQILQEIQNDVRKWNVEPGKFTDWIILMSMFNDIDWTRKGNDEMCNSNSIRTRRNCRRNTGPFSGLETKRSGMELFLTHLRENEILQPLTWWNDSMRLDSKIQVIQYSRVSVL